MSYAKQNIISLLIDNMDSGTAERVFSIMINTLTGTVVSNTMRHLQRRKRIEAAGFDPETLIQPIPTLDQRNEQDEYERGIDHENYVQQLQGKNIAEDPYQTAKVADGLRYRLYSMLHKFGQYDEDKHLVYDKKLTIEDMKRPVNFFQPMSAQTYLKFRIENTGKINDKEVEFKATHFKIEEKLIREALKQQGERDRAQLEQMRDAILREINGFNYLAETDGEWDSFAIETKVAIVEKMASKFDAAYMRLMPRAMRSLKLVGELTILKSYHDICRKWLEDNDDEFQAALEMRESMSDRASVLASLKSE